MTARISPTGQGHLEADDDHGEAEGLHENFFHPLGQAPARREADQAPDENRSAVDQGPLQKTSFAESPR